MASDDRTIEEYLAAIASEQVAPAGGSAVAIAGAMGAALCEMVCIHTLAAREDPNRDATADTDCPDTNIRADGEPTLRELQTDLERERGRLLALAGGDAELVEDLFGGGADGSTARLRKRATGVPLAIAEASVTVLEGATIASERGRPGVAADATTGAYLADAAIRASLATVRTNLETLSDDEFAADVAERMATIEAAAAALRTEAFDADFAPPNGSDPAEQDGRQAPNGPPDS
ncbi:cyclodeaminase/cyclohydrolase family protein [Halobellus marinus]|uniref:cyclodeaminase/cyclohydrolase family protein n=1 Tax=Halobellus TaxID=1073986 RepID=UPI0028A73D1D|nr:cyclodeaminase/cyclohydrolase family protein [Halobellus sp. DFY28]